MTAEQFDQSLLLNEPPPELSPYLQALWFDAKNDWNNAHSIIQDVDDATAAWIHAYLHRKEGDIGNADYWYRRANRKRPAVPLPEEWKLIRTSLL